MSTLTPDPKPRRKRRPWLLLLPVVLIAVAGLAMAIPGSPVYLPTLLQPEPSIDNKTRSQWAAELSSGDQKQRADAANALGKMNTGGLKALPQLVKAMQSDPDADVRATAADAIAKMYPANEPEAVKTEYIAATVGAFTGGLTDKELRVRYSSALGLIKLREHGRPAVPVLLAGCKDPENDTNLNAYHSTIRHLMLRALGEAAVGTPDAVPYFVEIVNIPVVAPKIPPGVNVQGGGGKPPSPELLEASKKYQDMSTVRRNAVTGLGLAGPHGRVAADKIRELLKSSHPDDKDIAKQALEQMGEPLEKQ